MAFQANVCRVWLPLISFQCTSGSNEEDEWTAEISTWNFEAIEDLGATLWPFLFGKSVWRLGLGAQPLVKNI